MNDCVYGATSVRREGGARNKPHVHRLIVHNVLNCALEVNPECANKCDLMAILYSGMCRSFPPSLPTDTTGTSTTSHHPPTAPFASYPFITRPLVRIISRLLSCGMGQEEQQPAAGVAAVTNRVVSIAIILHSYRINKIHDNDGATRPLPTTPHFLSWLG